MSAPFQEEPRDDAAVERCTRTWYVLHVKPRTEKKVFGHLEMLRVFRYLPLYKKVTKTQRRKVTRFLPLFPGYVFTRLGPAERLTMMKTQLLVRLIDVQNPRRMIHQLRQIAHAGRLACDLQPTQAFAVGEHVRMTSGPFRGMDGYVQRTGAQTKLVLELEILGRAVEVSVDPGDVEKAG